jgi:RimJ/RimL family protein N-acetyltransferase
VPGHERDEFHRIASPFEGERIRLRAVEESDLPRVSELFWNPEVTRHLVVAWPEAVTQTRDWWQRNRDNGDHLFAIETLAGELIGACGLEGINRRVHSAELGIWVAEPFWGKGFGTDAVRTVCRFGFTQLNLSRIALHVYETNPRGTRAYTKVGFREEGRLRSDQWVDGRPVDVIVMGLLANELT